MRIRSSVAPFVSFAIGCSSEPLVSTDFATVAQPVVGGTLATTCQWPTALRINGCTATLVHPKLVTFAAHCVEGNDFPKEVLFGEDDSVPERRVLVEDCKRYPDFVLGRTDVAYCTLTSEIRDVPATPIIMGCETEFLKAGNILTLVGFGFTRADAEETAGKKRWADVAIRRLVSGGQAIEVGLGTATACPGDSGGPLYAKLSDGTFRVVGAGSLTHIVDGQCVSPAYYTLLHKFVGWMETSSGLDLTPCHEADGTWSPGPDCGGFATAADRSNGTWEDGCNAGAISGGSATCDLDVVGGGDAQPPPSEAAPASRPSDPESCACRVGPGTGRAHEVWASVLALGWIGWFLKRRGSDGRGRRSCRTSRPTKRRDLGP